MFNCCGIAALSKLQSYHLGIEMKVTIEIDFGQERLQSYHLGIEIKLKQYFYSGVLKLQSYHLGIEILIFRQLTHLFDYSNRTI